MNLTENFTLEELTRSDYAVRHGLNNQPVDDDVLENMFVLALGLERVRNVIGKPIHITSGYRSPKVNAGVGGSKTSAHMKGLAADIVVSGMSAIEVCKELLKYSDEIGYDQIIHEGTWTHIAFPDVDETPRKQALTAIFKPGNPVRYVNGLV